MFVIRKAVREDVPAILGLVRELAAYEREPNAVVASEEDFLRDGFGEKPAFEVLIAEGSPGTGGSSPTAPRSRHSNPIGKTTPRTPTRPAAIQATGPASWNTTGRIAV